MTALAAPEGVIRARLFLTGGTITAVGIEPRPLPPLKALLKGKSSQEAVRLIPRLFSLCGVAQTVAGLDALEMALGIEAPAAQKALRLLLTLAETVGEHARHLLLDGPLAFGLPPDVAAAKAIRKHIAMLKPLLAENEDWIRPGGASLNCDPAALADWLEMLRKLVLSHVMAGNDVAGLGSASDVDGWSRHEGSVPARLLHKILRADLAGFGASATLQMNHLPTDALMARLKGDDERDFARAPRDEQGYCLETGSLSRQGQHPIIQSFQKQGGLGLAARLAARLIELSHAITGIALSIPLLDSDQPTMSPLTGSGEGIGLAEAARGRLAHWVALTDGMVEDYRLLAPTEWNFHPEGAFVQGLKGVRAADGQEAALKARWQALALDPCVSLEVEVSDA
jgi:coenzyme F420-reducing hydrogenase alpha subunit